MKRGKNLAKIHTGDVRWPSRIDVYTFGVQLQFVLSQEVEMHAIARSFVSHA